MTSQRPRIPLPRIPAKPVAEVEEARKVVVARPQYNQPFSLEAKIDNMIVDINNILIKLNILLDKQNLPHIEPLPINEESQTIPIYGKGKLGINKESRDIIEGLPAGICEYYNIDKTKFNDDEEIPDLEDEKELLPQPEMMKYNQPKKSWDGKIKSPAELVLSGKAGLKCGSQAQYYFSKDLLKTNIRDKTIHEIEGIINAGNRYRQRRRSEGLWTEQMDQLLEKNKKIMRRYMIVKKSQMDPDEEINFDEIEDQN